MNFGTVLVHKFPRALVARMSRVGVDVEKASAESTYVIERKRPRAMVTQEEITGGLFYLFLSSPSEVLRGIARMLLLTEHIPELDLRGDPPLLVA